MKKTFTLKLNQGLLSKLVLLVALFVGSSKSVFAIDAPIVILNGGTITTGWSKNTYLDTGATECYTNSTTMIAYIQSPSALTFNNKKLVIRAKRTADSDVFMGYSVEGSYYTYNYLFNYNNSSNKNKYEMSNSEEYVEYISDNFSVDSKIIRIVLKNVRVNSIQICDGKELVLDENTPTALQSTTKTEKVQLNYSAKSGWNTICVPFQLKKMSTYEHLTTIFGEEWQAYTLSSYDDGGRTLAFANALPSITSSINPNTPILVYAPKAVAHPEGIELTSNVEVSYNTESLSNTQNGATFQGTYTTKTYQELDDWYGVTTSGQIKKAGEGAYVKGYRAYFTGIAAPDPGARISLVIEGDEGTTDLGFVRVVDPEAKDVYTLSGQKVEKASKGIYIVNGRKVVIK